MKLSSKAWIFVSHSTRDIDKVRAVRNAIESAGGEPVLFFLKCLSDHDEIDDLIKREIEARNFFLLCKSKNTRNSNWVQDEIAHVNSLHDKQVEVIDLDADWQSQLGGITSLMRQATLYLSYAQKDKAVVIPIRQALMANDFAVWDPSYDLSGGDSFMEQMSSAIDDAARFGFILHFLSTASLSSKWVAYEIQRALTSDIGNRYIPVLLDPPAAFEDQLPEFIREQQWIDYSEGNLQAMLPQLLRVLGVRDTEVG